MSVRIETLGRDVLDTKPYKIVCGACDTAFSFIEKDATRDLDGAGFDRLSIPCPNCGTICLTGTHKSRKVEGAKGMSAEERAMGTGLVIERGRIKRPPEYTPIGKRKAVRS